MVVLFPADFCLLFFPSGKPASFRLHTDAKVSGGDSSSALSPLQSLAVTGLNMMSLSQPDASASANNKRFVNHMTAGSKMNKRSKI